MAPSSLNLNICSELMIEFRQIMKSTSMKKRKKVLEAKRVLNMVSTLVQEIQGQPTVVRQMETLLLPVVTMILKKFMTQLYEEVFGIVASLTGKEISRKMWIRFDSFLSLMKTKGKDYFPGIFPALYHFIMVDTESFLSVRKRRRAIATLIREVLTEDGVGEYFQLYALKLAEVMVLQCPSGIGDVTPGLLRAVLDRLGRPIQTSDLKLMTIQVVAASLYQDVTLLEYLNKDAMDGFIRDWIRNAIDFEGVHSRKVCVLGMCTLLKCPSRPRALDDCASELIPCLMVLFDGLKRAYRAIALENGDYDSEEDEEMDDEDDEMEDFEISEFDYFLTPVDHHESDIDEYVVFKETMTDLQQGSPDWFGKLTTNLSLDQRTVLQNIFSAADKRKAAIKRKLTLKLLKVGVPASYQF